MQQSQMMKKGFSEFSRSVLDILDDDPSPRNQPELEKFVQELSIMKFNKLALLETSRRSTLQRLLSMVRRLKTSWNNAFHREH